MSLRHYALLLFIWSGCSIHVVGQPKTVALTFDDLPASGSVNPAEVKAINLSILDALDRHHAPATGFVIGQHIDQISGSRAVLQEWRHRGYTIGNHTFTHPDFNTLTVAQEEEEILQAENTLGPLLGPGPKFLRFPFNTTGETPEKHAAILTFLKQHGYEVATCTIDNEDYKFARAYSLILAKHDEVSAAKLRQAYLDYTAIQIDFYSGLHQTLFGHEIPHVMLLHATRLNADTIEQILNIFEAKQYKFVTLATAQSDPAYATPDTYATKFGPMWAYRWSRELGIKVNGQAETDPPSWITQYGK